MSTRRNPRIDTAVAADLDRDELSDLVDRMEDEVETEWVESGRPGNADDRARTRPVEPDHQAPD